MSKICLVNPSQSSVHSALVPLPHATALAETLTRHDHQVIWLSGTDALKQQESLQDVHVMLFASAPEDLSRVVETWQPHCPLASFIWLDDGSPVDQPLEVVRGMDCLPVDAKPYEILSRVASAVHRSELYRQIDRLTSQDEGTGLYHLSYFLERMNSELSLSRRHQSTLSCVVFELGYFQILLDAYGHEATQSLLMQIGQQISQLKRQEDTIAKAGDAQIVVLLPHSSEEAAVQFVKRVLTQMNDFMIQINDDESEVPVLFSGVVSYPLSTEESDVDADKLIRYARHALHHARCSDATDEAGHATGLFSAIRPALWNHI